MRAPRGGFVDSIPFKLGDESPVGASLVVMLTGNTPYARVYVPQPIRHKLRVGSVARVALTGIGGDSLGTFVGRVRMVRNAPSFTPYHALTGDDVARLSYIAEIQLREDAAQLPAGLPLRAVFLSANVDSAPPARTPLGRQIEPSDEAPGYDGTEGTADPPASNMPTEQRRVSDHDASFEGGK